MKSVITSKFLKFYPIIIFVTIYIVFSFVTYKNIPITTDEETRYKWGQQILDHFLNSKYLQTTIKPLKEPDMNSLYPTILNILNPNFYYEQFHLQNLLFSSISFIVLYFLCYKYTNNPKFSIVGPLFLALTPGFSGFLGNNPADTPFAIFCILNIFLIYHFKNTGFNFTKIIVLGISFWPLISIRPVGAQFFLHFIVLTLLFLPSSGRIKYLFDEFKNIVLIGFISYFLMVITWPYLGVNFFKNYPSILLTNSSYDKWNNTILFEGIKIPGLETPWYYLFTYLFYTLPLFILVLFFVSLINLKIDKLKIFILYIIVLNLLLYLAIDPVIYNGLRHFLFLIPMIVALASFGLFDLYKSIINVKVKIIIYCISVFSIVWTIYEMVNLYPNHYAYFNEISGGFRNNYLKYETEYWGGSYKFAAEYVRDSLSSQYNDLKVNSCFLGFGVQYYSKGKYRHVIDQSDADLIICDVVSEMSEKNLGEVLYEVKLHGVTFVNVRKNLNKD